MNFWTFGSWVAGVVDNFAISKVAVAFGGGVSKVGGTVEGNFDFRLEGNRILP